MCPACRHPRRLHLGDAGCTRGGDCWCELTEADFDAAPAAPEPAAHAPSSLPMRVDDGTRPLPPLPDSAYPPNAVPLKPVEKPSTAALMWWDAWHCTFCYSRYFTERTCCDQPAIPVRVMVLPREVAA